MIQATQLSPFQRVLSVIGDCLTPEVAHRLSQLRVDDSLQRRLDELGSKANFGELTEAEREEHEELMEGLEVLSLVKAQAQLVLTQQDES